MYDHVIIETHGFGDPALGCKPPNIPRVLPWKQRALGPLGSKRDRLWLRLFGTTLRFRRPSEHHKDGYQHASAAPLPKKKELHIIYWHILTYTGLLISYNLGLSSCTATSRYPAENMHTSQVSHQFHGSVKVHPGSFRSCDVDWVRPSRPSKSSGRQTLHAFDDVFEVGVGGFVPANVAVLSTLWPSGGRMLFAWQGTVYFATDMIVIFEDTFMATSDFKSSFINHQATTSHNVCQGRNCVIYCYSTEEESSSFSF